MAVQNNGGEFQEYQSAQNQLLNIRAQQEQNLNEQRVMAQSDASTNNVLYQAAGLMADNTNTETATNFNPQTQAVLNQYGLGQPRIQKSSSSQSSTQQVSKQNIVINNNYKTENTTTNNVTVPSGGPIQGRPVTIGDNGIGKFKVWLNTTFAQQQEAAAKRDREYEIRQANLSKDSNKLMRKLEMVGTNVGKALDPRRISQATSDPMKMLFTTLGIVTIAKSWPRIMEFVNNADNFFNGGKLTKLLGGKEGETPFEALKGLVTETRNDVKKSIETGLKKRRAALRQVESDINFGIGGDGIETTLKKAITYLANVTKVLVDPDSLSKNKLEVQQAAEEDINVQRLDPSQSDYIRKNNRAIDRQNEVEVIDKNGNRFRGKDLSKGAYGSWKLSPTENISGANRIEHLTQNPMIGDRNILKLDDQGAPVYKGLPGYSITNTGDLSSTIGAQIAAGQEIIRLFKTSNKDAINTAAIAQQLARLVKPLNENGEVVISDYFKKFFEKDPFEVKDFAEKYDKNNLLYAIDSNNRIVLIDKKDKDKYDYVLEDSPANEGQELYKVTSEGFQKILQALAGTKSYNGGDWNLTTDIKSTDVNFQNKLHNKLSELGVKITSFPDYQYTDNTHAFNNIMSYELERDEIEAEYQKYKQENSDRRNNASEEINNLFKPKIHQQNQEINLEPYKDRVKKALDFFMNDKELDLNESQAKAIVANLIEESNINPAVENGNGIAQWLGDRKKHLLNYYNQNNNTNETNFRNISLDDQLGLVKYELLDGDMKNFFTKFKEGYTENGQRISDLDAFMRGYELGGNTSGILASIDWINSNKIVSQNSGLTYEGHLGRRTKKLNALSTFTIDPENVSLATVSPQVIAKPDLVTQDVTDFINLHGDEITTVQNNPSLDPETKQLLEQLHVDLLAVIDGTRTIDENMVNKMVEQINAILQSNNQPPININQTQSYTS
jgi:hypothetical protein